MKQFARVKVAGRQMAGDRVSGTRLVTRRAECSGIRTEMWPVTATSSGRRTWGASSSSDWRTIACRSRGPASCPTGQRGMSIPKVISEGCCVASLEFGTSTDVVKVTNCFLRGKRTTQLDWGLLLSLAKVVFRNKVIDFCPLVLQCLQPGVQGP